MRRILRQIARAADARVFVVAGSAARDEARFLRLSEGIRFATTPRAGNILLIVGDLDPGLVVPTLVSHDALAQPRATVWWHLDSRDDVVPSNFPDAVVVDDPVPALRRVHERLLSGDLEGEPPLLSDVEPAPWRDVGPYGQGGKAMTGGVPYGRPMADRADDRDGLKLDYLPIRVGPLFAAFPPGLALDVKLQGDVIQEAKLENFAGPVTQTESIFYRALREPVAIRDVELARARSHLQWLSDAVAVAGPASLARRILHLAQRIQPADAEAIEPLERSLRRRGFFGWSTRGIGVIRPDDLHGITGPVARASGSSVDSRGDDPSYQRLGFEPVTQQAGDASARWIQRIKEAHQSLDLAERAGDALTDGSGTIESPRGTLVRGDGGHSGDVTALVPSLVAGMEWGEAVTSIVSLDLDMAEAASVAKHTTIAS